MVNKTAPEYLSNLVPSSFGQTHQYSTRNHYNLVHVHSRTAYYKNSYPRLHPHILEFDINSVVFHFDDSNYGRRSQPYCF
jgi:hypothetical protein